MELGLRIGSSDGRTRIKTYPRRDDQYLGKTKGPKSTTTCLTIVYKANYLLAHAAAAIGLGYLPIYAQTSVLTIYGSDLFNET